MQRVVRDGLKQLKCRTREREKWEGHAWGETNKIKNKCTDLWIQRGLLLWMRNGATIKSSKTPRAQAALKALTASCPLAREWFGCYQGTTIAYNLHKFYHERPQSEQMLYLMTSTKMHLCGKDIQCVIPVMNDSVCLSANIDVISDLTTFWTTFDCTSN